MATYTVPAGTQVINFGSSGPFFDVYDAETNNSVFLADYLDYVANNRTESHVSAYPARFWGANPFVWNGGTLLGNIPETADWNIWYNQGNQNFNSAVIFPRGNISGTFNRVTIGQRDNLDSYPADGIRTVQAGTVTINNLTVWGCRDDVIEHDGNSDNLTLNDFYGENLFIGISATGNIPSTNIRINRALMHFRAWNYFGVNRFGMPFKTDGPSASPNWLLDDVVLAVGPSSFADGGERLTGALANTTCTGDCRVLVPGGTLQSTTIRNAYIAAGFTVVEGAAATNEYAARKAAWLAETTPDPTPEPEPEPPAAFAGTVTTRIICSDGFLVPATDANLIAYFSPTAEATLTQSGAAVSAWSAQIGTGALQQGVAAAQPSRGARLQNLRTVIDGTGDDFMAGNVTIPADGDYAVHFAAIVDGVTNAFQSIIGMNTHWQLEAGNASQFNGFLRVDGTDDLTLTGGPYSGLVIGSVEFDKTGNEIRVYLNGALRGSGTYGSTPNVSQSLKVLTNRAQSQFLNGSILDVAVTADTTNGAAWRAFLAARWEE